MAVGVAHAARIGIAGVRIESGPRGGCICRSACDLDSRREGGSELTIRITVSDTLLQRQRPAEVRSMPFLLGGRDPCSIRVRNGLAIPWTGGRARPMRDPLTGHGGGRSSR